VLLLGLPLFDALLARGCAQEQNQPNLQKSPSSLYLAPVSPACDAQSSQPTDRPCNNLCSLRPLTWDPTALSLSLAHLYLSFSLLSSLVDTSSLSTLRLAPLLQLPFYSPSPINSQQSTRCGIFNIQIGTPYWKRPASCSEPARIASSVLHRLIAAASFKDFSRYPK
jgi:hypothetical protein